FYFRRRPGAAVRTPPAYPHQRHGNPAGGDQRSHGRPSFLRPCSRTRFRPATTLALIISLSSSPKTQAIWIMALPNGLVLSMACWSLYRATPAESNPAVALATCSTLLPNRSIDQHVHTSNRRRTASVSIWLN